MNSSKNLYTWLGFLQGVPTIILGFRPEISGVSLINIIILIFLFIYNKKISVPTIFFAFIIFFYLFSTFSYFFFTKTEYSTYKYLMIFVKILPMLLIPLLLKSNINDYIIGYIYAGLISIISIYFFLFYFSGIQTNGRIYIGNLNPIWISRIICELIIILIIFQKSKITLLLVFLSIPILFLAGSKGPILSLLIVLLLYFFNSIQASHHKHIYNLLFLFIAIFFGLAFYKFISDLNPNSFFIQRFFRTVPDYARGNVYETSRVVVWPKTIDLIKDHLPRLLFIGYGIGNYSNLYYGVLTHERIYPHNIILELISEYGFFFTSTMLLVLVYCWASSSKYSNYKYLLLYFLINAMFSGDIILNEYIFFYASMMLADTTVRKKQLHIAESI